MKKRLSSRPSDLKFDNKSTILRHIYENGVVTKTEICHVIGLSKPTTSSLIDELVKDNLVVVAGIGQSTERGGKRPFLYQFNPDFGSIVSLHIASDTIRGVLMNPALRVLSRRERCLSNWEISLTLDIIASLVGNLLLDSQKTGIRLLGIAVSAPGIIQYPTGVLTGAVRLEGWAEIPLGPYLREAFGLPVWIDNESRNMARAEQKYGMARHISNFVSLQTKNGLGTGIVLQGEITTGPDSSVGEFGHSTVDLSGARCRCGNVGCWELYGTEGAFLSELSQALKEDGARESSLAKALEDGHSLDMKLVGHHYDLHDTFTTKQVTSYGLRLGVGIVNIVNVLNPELIILHGDIHELGDRFLTELANLVQSRGLHPAVDRVRLAYSTFSEGAEMIGAASMVVEELLCGGFVLNP